MKIIDGVLYEYLGDGVYACYDGYGIWLRTNDHREHLCTDKVYLEPAVLESLNKFISKAEEKKNDLCK